MAEQHITRTLLDALSKLSDVEKSLLEDIPASTTLQLLEE